MGSIKFSGLVTGIKGKIGGTVFQTNRNGYSAKNNTGKGHGYVIGDGGVARMKQNLRVATLASAWGTLTPEQRNAWINEATNWTFFNRFGDPYTPSGYELFLHVNLNLLQADRTPINEPATQQEIIPIANFQVLNSSISNFEIRWTAPTNYRYRILVYGSRQQKQGKSISGQTFKFISSIGANITLPYDLTNDLLNAYKILQAGATIWLKVDVVNIETGQRSASFFTSVVLQS
jgi:hypothetical protein